MIDVLPDGSVGSASPNFGFARLLGGAVLVVALGGFVLALAFFLSVAIALLPFLAAAGVGVFLLRSFGRPAPRVPQSFFR